MPGVPSEAGDRQKIDFHRNVDGARQRGEKEHGAFQYPDQLQIATAIFGADLGGHLTDARGHLLFSEQDALDSFGRGHVVFNPYLKTRS